MGLCWAHALGRGGPAPPADPPPSRNRSHWADRDWGRSVGATTRSWRSPPVVPSCLPSFFYVVRPAPVRRSDFDESATVRLRQWGSPFPPPHPTPLPRFVFVFCFFFCVSLRFPVALHEFILSISPVEEKKEKKKRWCDAVRRISRLLLVDSVTVKWSPRPAALKSTESNRR